MSNPIPPDETRPLPLPLARHVDEVCCRFEAAWKAVASGAEPPRLEDYLTEVAEPAQSVLLRELLKVEAHHRRRAGDEPRGDDYRGRLPDLDPNWLAEVLAPDEPDKLLGWEGRGLSAGSAQNPTLRTSQGSEGKTEAMTLFLEALWRTDLLDPQQTQALLGQADVVHEPEELAAWLVARRWLTLYQARHLLAGNPNELILGNYRLLEPLGEGGMGQVFKARHPLMNRMVAIKLIRPDVVYDPVAVHRFHLEIRALAQLNHPNVVVALDAEEARGRHFLVMEFCEGVTLRRLVEQTGPLPAELACEYVRQTALGLQHAFERGLIHRDLKPENLMLCGTTVKILDFGLARLRSGDAPPVSVTRAGVIVGTPDFMAPEQAEGRADIRSDLYSLGCTLYFLLTGRPPFPDGTAIQKFLYHRSEEPEPPERQRPGVPAPVQEIVRRLMAKNPDDRFQTPAEVAAGLAPFARLCPTPALREANSASLQTDDPFPTLSSAPEAHRLRQLPGPRQVTWRTRWVVAGVVAALPVALVCIFFLATSNRLRQLPGLGQLPNPVSLKPPEKLQPPPRTWRKLKTLPIPQPGLESTYGLAFSPDSRLLAGVFGNNESSGPKEPGPGHLRVWEVAGWRVAHDKEVESGPATCVAFSPDGERLAWGTGCWNHNAPGHVTLWSVAEWAEIATFKAHPKGVFALAFQPRNDLRFSAALVDWWVTGIQADAATPWMLGLRADRFSKVEGEPCLATSGREGKVRLWEVRSGSLRRELREGKIIEGEAYAQNHFSVMVLAFSPDGGRLASGCEDGTIDLWEMSTLKPLGPISTEPAKPIRGLALLADGQTILAVTKKGRGSTADLLEWKGQDFRQGPTIPVGETEAYRLALSADKATFLVACQNKTAKLYQTATRRELQTLKGEYAFSCLAFSPDGRYLATGGTWDERIQIWEEAE